MSQKSPTSTARRERVASFQVATWLRVVLAVAALGGCRQDMHDQLKYEPLEKSEMFEDGLASRHPVKGTIARGQLKADRSYYFGREPLTEPLEGPDDGSVGELVASFPHPVDQKMMRRGRQRFDIFCSPCHGQTGNGDGMIVRRGYRQPPSLHSDKVKNAKVGHLYDVIRRGFGVMPAYATMVPVEDRWAIVAYIRALQLSKSATLDDVPPAERAKLTEPPVPQPAEEGHE